MRTALLLAAAALIACGGAEPKPAPTPAPEPETRAPAAATEPAAPGPKASVLAEIRGLATEMCECRDFTCAERSRRALGVWLKDIAKRYSEEMLDSVETEVMARFKPLRRCFNKLAPPDKQMADPDRKGSPESLKMEALADKMCRCSGPACAHRTHKEMTEWIAAHFKGGKRKGTKENVDRWKAAQKRFIDCFSANLNKSPKK